MPFLVMKRDDIPRGTLQVLDLAPNTSNRNLIYEPVGQTKYVNPVQNDPVDLTAGPTVTFATAANGLAAWFATTIDDGGGASLTKVEAEGNAAAVLALYAFGDLTAAAGAMDLATVNGALVAGALTADQHTTMMQILAGRDYTVPRNVEIETGGAFGVVPAVGDDGGPVLGPYRETFTTGQLRISILEGRLAGFLDSGFVYADTAGDPNGEALVVYDDDGTIFVP